MMDFEKKETFCLIGDRGFKEFVELSLSYLGFSVAANNNTMTKKQVEERVYSSYTSR